MTDVYARIESMRDNTYDLLARVAAEVRAACPGPHKLVQHRDGKSPWCRVCGYTAGGVRVKAVGP